MSQTTVGHIIELIDKLSDVDYELLGQQFAERDEAAWRREAEQARREARGRGIDQATIDEVIHRRRYRS